MPGFVATCAPALVLRSSQICNYPLISHSLNTLQNHYREIPVTFIQQTLKEQGSFYKAYLRLEEADRTYSATLPSTRPYRRVRIREIKPLNPAPSQKYHVDEAMEHVLRETRAAKKKVEKQAGKHFVHLENALLCD